MKVQHDRTKRQPWQWALTVLAFLVAISVFFAQPRMMPLIALAFVFLIGAVLWWAYKRTDGYKHL